MTNTLPPKSEAPFSKEAASFDLDLDVDPQVAQQKKAPARLSP